MTVSLQHLTFDCDDTAVVASFWSAALGQPVDPDGNEWIHTITTPGPRWLFLKVPEAKTAKNRLHLDLSTPDRPAEVERLVGLGAALLDGGRHDADRVLMSYPDGNEFRVLPAGADG